MEKPFLEADSVFDVHKKENEGYDNQEGKANKCMTENDGESVSQESSEI